MFGFPEFHYYGKIDFPVYGKFQYPDLPRLNPKLKLAFEFYFPDKVEGDVLVCKYAKATRYPYAEYNSMRRYGATRPLPSAVTKRRAERMLFQCFSELRGSKIIAQETAYEFIEKTSSPGHPWCSQFSTKNDLIASGIFCSYYNWFESEVKKGARPVAFWKSFIKKEYKKRVDLNLHNPRTILASSIELTLLGNRLYADMNAKMGVLGACFEIPCWIGVSKFNRNWHKLALLLQKFPNIFDGDCSKFDGSVSDWLLLLIKKLRKWFLSRKDWEKAQDYYYDNVIYSMIIGMLGELYLKYGGQPSGQVNTLTDNSLVHIFLFFFHWCTIVAPSLKLPCTWASFKEHVFLMVMGDDVIYSCSDFVLLLMKPSVVAGTFLSLQFFLKYSYDEPRPIEDLEFCSMRFQLYGEVYVPILKREKMMCSIFCDPSDNPRILLRRLFSIRVDIYFDELLRKAVDAAIDGLIESDFIELSRRPTHQGGDDLTFEQLKTLRKTDYEIVQQYLQVY